MKDRIAQIIDYKGLTSSKFADIIGIQRSRISHIMSGRNNPSIDVVTKIVDKFPDIDLKWLMTGQGEMLSSDINLFSKENISDASKDIIDYSTTKEPITTESVKNKPIPQSSSKKIERIIVFYTDSSFKEFKPE
jgi:transcriptional regulator with XRE-family HTH domain